METSIAAPSSSDAARRGEWFGHPRGLAFIAFTEAWERFSFYGMQALLVLYMTGQLLLPGHVEKVWGFQGFEAVLADLFGSLSRQALASQIFGLYVGLVYFAPVLGGLIGDRLVGRRRAVLAGAALMAGGHFLMAIEAAFLPALGLLILGCGLLKGNLAAQVGALYAKEDRRRDGAYTIYCTAINIGAFVAPLVCGSLGELYGWHYGFTAAGIGMMLSILIYLIGMRHLAPEAEPFAQRERVRLAPGEGRVVWALLALLAVTALYWIAQTQVWNTYPLWLRDNVDRSIGGGLAVPVTWFQALDSLAVLLLAPVMIILWKRQAARGVEPGDMSKIVIGMLLYGGACLLLTVGQATAGGGQVWIVWPVLFHFVCAVAYLYAAPIALALVSRAAPAAVNAMMVGAYYLAIFVGGIVSGWLGRFWEPLGPALFWALHGGIAIAGAAILILLRGAFLRALHVSSTTAG